MTSQNYEALARENEKLKRQLERMRRVARMYRLGAKQAEQDYLTGLLNKRGLEKALEEQIKIVSRYPDRNLSVVYIDLDKFKEANDGFGHDAGDEILRRFANILASEVRETDKAGKNGNGNAARPGGDEYLLVLPDTVMDGARVAAERICQRTLEILYPEYGIGFSAGISSLEKGIINYVEPVELSDTPYVLSRLLKYADSGMYKAKRAGRNRVEVVNEKLESLR